MKLISLQEISPLKIKLEPRPDAPLRNAGVVQVRKALNQIHPQQLENVCDAHTALDVRRFIQRVADRTPLLINREAVHIGHLRRFWHR